MEVEELIKHPKQLDRETLYDLRSLLALYPYYQTARILLLQNLYILHDPSFDEELRRAAIYITDRKVIFKMIEAAHYQLKRNSETVAEEQTSHSAAAKVADNGDRTTTLIDDFLDSIPQEGNVEEKKNRRKPTPADAAVDYVSYLMECETDDPSELSDDNSDRTTQLIDNFMVDGGFNLKLNDEEEAPSAKKNAVEEPEKEGPADAKEEQEEEEEVKPAPIAKESNEGYFTETLARIYIKQGKYEKALEIIQQLYLNYPKKSVYFADQMRFLEKLIIINKK